MAWCHIRSRTGTATAGGPDSRSGDRSFRLSFTMAVAVLLTLVAPGWIATISERSAGASILTGLAVEVLFVPALVVLMVALTVSIIGIPLLADDSFRARGVRAVWVAGFTGVAVRIGRALAWPRRDAGRLGRGLPDRLRDHHRHHRARVS